MLDQDTDRPTSRAHLDYWRKKLPTSPGMNLHVVRRPALLTERVLRQWEQRLLAWEAELQRREDELRQVPQPVATPSRLVSVDDIVHLCAAATGANVGEIISDRRTNDIVMVRHCVCWLAKRLSGMSLSATGKKLGGLHHTTVWHGIRRINKRLAAGDADVIAIISYVEARLG